MQIFFSQEISGNVIRLGEAEAKHCFKILRHKSDEIIHITDGKGNLYRCLIESHNLFHHQIRIVETITPGSRRPYYLELVVAPTKNLDRMEWMVEKLIETGVDTIRFVKTQRTEKGSLKMERLNNKAISAIKQSLHYTLPQLWPMSDFGDLIHEETDALKLIAWCHDHPVRKHIQFVEPSHSYRILIGPEGDFTPTEIHEAMSQGYCPVSLGASRFRTETAALAACMALYLKFSV